MDHQPHPKPRYIGYRIALAAVVLLIAGVLVMMPLSLMSALSNIVADPNDLPVWVTPEPAAIDITSEDWKDLVFVELLSIDEIQQTVSLRVAGVNLCSVECAYRDRLVFFSHDPDAPTGLGFVPPHETVVLPADRGEVIARFQLPMSGDLIHYPFDRYQLRLGIRVEREWPDQTVQRLSPEQTRDHLHVLAQSSVPRLQLDPPRDLAGSPEAAQAGYVVYSALLLQRPDHLKVLVPSVILLLTAAGAYAVFMRPFDQLIINAGALVLGVWGARALLLGSYPPDVTAVDTALTGVILFLLLAISFRAAHYLYRRSGFESLPWRRSKLSADPPPDE